MNDAPDQRRPMPVAGARRSPSDIGLAALGRGDWSTAERILRVEASTNTDDVAVLNNLALALIAQGRATEARYFMGTAQVRDLQGASSTTVKANARQLAKLTGSRLSQLYQVGAGDPAPTLMTPTGVAVFTAADPDGARAGTLYGTAYSLGGLALLPAALVALAWVITGLSSTFWVALGVLPVIALIAALQTADRDNQTAFLAIPESSGVRIVADPS